MQLKFKRESSLGQSLFRRLIKFLLILIALLVSFFLLEKINFSSPSKDYKIDITNETIKLK